MSDIDTTVGRVLGKWREETMFYSSLSRMQEHPCFHELVALGTAAVPALLASLTREPTWHATLALYAITGASPVPMEHAGRMKLVAEDWLRWGRENGYAVAR